MFELGGRSGATNVKISTMAVSAPAHARACPSWNPVTALSKICSNRDTALCWVVFGEQVITERGQEQRGGLSHGARDSQHGAGDDPRERAVGMHTRITVSAVAPSARLPSRSSCRTQPSISSVVRVTAAS